MALLDGVQKLNLEEKLRVNVRRACNTALYDQYSYVAIYSQIDEDTKLLDDFNKDNFKAPSGNHVSSYSDQNGFKARSEQFNLRLAYTKESFEKAASLYDRLYIKCKRAENATSQ
ncbi:Uncharacterised protein [BD1-7 clade bacterium]|uniref:Uncharacterized protein n=1 Tax=BD1-7 clade bacterium TaxID=2029982 RepID=A0A5S9NN90_9GAMM|nr:Uncharacterised protein [BD1-7 clade bacterium]CAA0094389.1 Uncharacterised protein [BD1-7 clade bacterium]